MLMIEMGERSQELLQNLYNKNTQSLSWVELLEYLEKTIMDDSGTLLLRESFRAALLYDLQRTFLSKQTHKSDQDSDNSWLGWFKWGLLATAGTIYAACDGFDGITTILALFPTIPLGLIFAAGFVFALLSVFVFYGFYLVDVSDKPDVKAGEQGHLIDVLLEQSKHLEQLLKISQMMLRMSHDLDELKTLEKMVKQLDSLYTNLQVARDSYDHQLQNPYLNAIKTVTAIFSGILFFGYGFFGGQSLALTMLGLVILSPTAAFWPVMAISIAVGLAAFSVYWLIERPGLEKLVGRFFGLDENKIEHLPDKAVVEQQKINLIEVGDGIKARVLEEETKKSQPVLHFVNIAYLSSHKYGAISLFSARPVSTDARTTKKDENLQHVIADQGLTLFSNKKMSLSKRSVSTGDLDGYIQATIPLYI